MGIFLLVICFFLMLSFQKKNRTFGESLFGQLSEDPNAVDLARLAWKFGKCVFRISSQGDMLDKS